MNNRANNISLHSNLTYVSIQNGHKFQIDMTVTLSAIVRNKDHVVQQVLYTKSY